MEMRKRNHLFYDIPRNPMEGTVQRLYHYMSRRNDWIDTLLNAHLKLSRPNDFNDIFDCSGVCIGYFTQEAFRKHLRKISDDSVGKLSDSEFESLRIEYSDIFRNEFHKRAPFCFQAITCFSAPLTEESDILMWSHYANKWHGIRLGFDMLFENHAQLKYGNNTPYYLNIVQYSKDRATIDLSQITDIDDLDEYRHWYHNIVMNKAKVWQYENEWRLIAIERESEKVGELRFWRFDRRILRSLDVGPQVSVSEKKEVLDIVSKYYPRVDVREVTPDSRLFKINYHKMSL